MSSCLKLLPLALLFCAFAYGQQSTAKQKHILALPVFSKAKETGIAYGFAGLSTFSTCKKDTLTKTSQVYAATIYTTQKQLFVGILGKIYLPQNKYMIDHEISFRSYPEKFWGIGNKSPDSVLDIYKYQQYYLFVHIMKQVRKNFYLGMRAQLQDIAKISYTQGGTFDNQIIVGRTPYKTVGIGGSITYDSRNDVFASTSGMFVQAQYIQFAKVIASDYQFNTVTLDFRKYTTVFKNKVLAFQGYYSGSFGQNVPIRSLALFGGSNSIRGYYRGRYRGNQAYYFQTEYRVPVYKRLGAVAFCGVGDVANDFRNYDLNYLKYSFGTGLRFAVNKSERLNIRLDVAFARYGNKGLYLDIGESF